MIQESKGMNNTKYFVSWKSIINRSYKRSSLRVEVMTDKNYRFEVKKLAKLA